MFVAVGSKHVVTLVGVYMIIVLVVFVFFLFPRPSSDAYPAGGERILPDVTCNTKYVPAGATGNM